MRVVFPASGWEMMAKVRRRLTSWGALAATSDMAVENGGGFHRLPRSFSQGRFLGDAGGRGLRWHSIPERNSGLAFRRGGKDGQKVALDHVKVWALE